MTDPVLQVRAAYELASAPAGTARDVHLVVEARASGKPIDGARPPLRACFALDVSGSMNGDPLQQVVDSVCRLVDLLHEDDHVGVVAFASSATLVVEPRALDADHKRVLKRRVQALTAGGGTSIDDGLRAAAEALGARAPQARHAILLLTDGQDATPGLAERAASFRPDVSTTCLGYGLSHDEDLLQSIAKSGGGQYFFVADPKEAGGEFGRALGAQGDVVVDGVEIVVAPADGVELGAPRGAAGAPRVTARGLSIPLPDLRDGARHVVVVPMTVALPAEAGAFAPATIVAKHRAAGTTRTTTSDVAATIAVRGDEAVLDPWASAQVLVADAEAARADGRAHADRGAFEAAAALVRRVMARLAAHPSYRAGSGDPLDEAYEQLLDEATTYELKPSAEHYAMFRKGSLGVDVAQGGVHVGDQTKGNALSQAMSAAAAGDVPEAYARVLVRGVEQQRVRLGAEATIGRAPTCEVVVPSGSLSRRHTRVACRAGRFLVADLGSTNGTRVNGQNVRGAPRELRDGDRIELGDVVVEISLPKP